MWLQAILEWLDRRTENTMRSSAQKLGRRSFLAYVGTTLVGGTLLPMLPFERSKAAHGFNGEEDETSCDYWAYCGIDGVLCNACGGSTSQCPPGSEPSKMSWVGTCQRAKDKKAYLISYSDCCGKSICQEEVDCSRHVGERPGYRMGTSSDMNWCMANTAKGVSCSTAVVIGLADSE